MERKCWGNGRSKDQYGEPNEGMREEGWRRAEREGLKRKGRDQSRAEIKGVEGGRKGQWMR